MLLSVALAISVLLFLLHTCQQLIVLSENNYRKSSIGKNTIRDMQKISGYCQDEKKIITFSYYSKVYVSHLVVEFASVSYFPALYF